LLESLRLFKGIKVFQKNGLIHHDLKPQNIVFDETKLRLNFIDFGLMVSRSKILKKCKESTYDFSIFHWSYPWEVEFLNKNSFDNLAKSTINQRQIMTEITKEISEKKGDYFEHVDTFFFYVLDKNVDLSSYQEECSKYLLGYEETITKNMQEMSYDDFLESSVDTLDIFGLGISLLYWFNCAKKFLTKELSDELNVILKNMINSELKLRPNIDMLLQDMETLFEKHGLLQKYSKKIRDHLVVPADSISPTLPKPEKNIFSKSLRPNRVLATTSPRSCKEGYFRNELGKCVKLKLSRKLLKPLKPCPAGKKRNPKTKRCVKLCNPGFVRDDNYRCVKNKTMRL
jgi:serine/threonine protein kinase